MTSSIGMAALPPGRAPFLYAYVGHGNPTGDIQIYAFEATGGALTRKGSVPSGSSTSYMAIHPHRHFAYTTQNRSNRLTAFAIDARTGQLERLNDVAVPAAPGENDAGPAYVTVDGSGRFVLAANYRGHNVVVFALEQDGRIGALVASHSAGRHAHCVRLSPDNRFAFVPYLGSDLVAQYRFDETTGALEPHDPPSVPTAAGAGPRHLTFAPDGTQAFLINELDATLTTFLYDAASGTLAERGTVPTLPGDYTGRRWAADVHVHPNGRLVYVSNRAHDSLAVFAIDPAGGPLSLVERIGAGGVSPRNFCLDPGGRFALASNQDSNNLALFAIDPASGRLAPRGEQPVAASPYYVRLVALAG